MIRGLEIAIIVLYIPLIILNFACFLGRKDVAWMFLCLFCLARNIGAALLLCSSPSSDNLFVAVDILDSAGLSLLFLALLGFLGLVRRNGQYSDNATFSRVFFTAPTAPVSSSFALLVVLAFSLSVAPAAKDEEYSSHADGRWQSIREASAILFAVIFVLFIIIYILHAVLYHHNPSLSTRRGRELLLIFSPPLLFLAVRVTYYVLSTYSLTHPSLAKYNMLNGSWGLYLGMSVVMEFMIVLMYDSTWIFVYLFYGSGM